MHADGRRARVLRPAGRFDRGHLAAQNREDNLPIYRWVREGGRDQLWQGTAGEGHIRFGLASGRSRIHFDFHITMVPLRDTGGSVYVYSGDVKCSEDLARTQGLMNRYGEWLARLIATPETPGDESPGR